MSQAAHPGHTHYAAPRPSPPAPRLAARTRETLGRIDVVVANAGFGVMGPLETLTLGDYRRQFETNVFGVLRTVYATLEDVKRARGRLVLLGSVSGHLALPGASAYAMSKFAVRGLAEALAHELAPRGVAVTLVSPGLVESEMRQVDNRGRWHAEAARGWARWTRSATARPISPCPVSCGASTCSSAGARGSSTSPP